MDGILYKDLMESYQQVHQDSLDEDVIPEELEAFASALIEEGYDLSDVTWDEVREAYLEEGIANDPRWGVLGQGARLLQKGFGNKKQGDSAREYETSVNNINKRRRQNPSTSTATANEIAAETKGRAAQTPSSKKPADKSGDNKPSYKGPGGNPDGSGQGQAQQRSAGTGGSGSTQKVAKVTAKPVQTATQKKDASTNAEYDRLRKSDPAAAKKFGMAASKKKFGNQLKPKTPNPLMSKPATSTAPKPSASPIKSSRLSAALDSVKKPAAKPAAGAKFNPNAPKIKLNNSVELSDFDIILEHLIEQGFGNDEALKIMVNMSEEKREEILVAEGYKGKHGQSDEEQMDSRSDAAKQISGDSKYSGAAYSHRSYRGVGKPAKPGERQKDQGKMTDADRDELAIRKNALKKKTRKEEDESLYQAYLSMMSEEDYDKRKDSDLERGGMNARKDDREPLATGTGVGKKKASGDAFGQVVSKLKKQYGDKAIMDKKSRKES